MTTEQSAGQQDTGYASRYTVYAGYQGKPDPSEQERIIDLLQAYQSTEHFNSRAVAAWAEATGNDKLRGGLLTVRAREAAHTGLLRGRLRDFGVTAYREVPAERRDRDLGFFGSPEQSDLDKMSILVRVLAEPDTFFEPIFQLIDQIADHQTGELLRTILADEYTTTVWFKEMHAELAAQAA